MQSLPLTAALRLFAPVFAARLAGILAAVAALVARRFVRDARLSGHTLQVWGWLQRRATRCRRLAGRIAAGRVPAPRPPRAARSGSGARLALPRGQAWLVQILGSEAAAYGSQLQALLADPETAALLAAVPALARLVAPVAQMLGLGPARPRPQRFMTAAALAAVGAAFLLPIPHDFAWPRGPDRQT